VPSIITRGGEITNRKSSGSDQSTQRSYVETCGVNFPDRIVEASGQDGLAVAVSSVSASVDRNRLEVVGSKSMPGYASSPSRGETSGVIASAVLIAGLAVGLYMLFRRKDGL
jgi:hypothetical protein